MPTPTLTLAANAHSDEWSEGSLVEVRDQDGEEPRSLDESIGGEGLVDSGKPKRDARDRRPRYSEKMGGEEGEETDEGTNE